MRGRRLSQNAMWRPRLMRAVRCSWRARRRRRGGVTPNANARTMQPAEATAQFLIWGSSAFSTGPKRTVMLSVLTVLLLLLLFVAFIAVLAFVAFAVFALVAVFVVPFRIPGRMTATRRVCGQRGHGATAARRTPDQKVGSSNLPALIWICSEKLAPPAARLLAHLRPRQAKHA